MMWQPIETAPKDGRCVLVAWPETAATESAVAVAWWKKGKEYEFDGEMVRDKDAWTDSDNGPDWVDQPSYWLPLSVLPPIPAE
jgi:hypothetical protein